MLSTPANGADCPVSNAAITLQSEGMLVISSVTALDLSRRLPSTFKTPTGTRHPPTPVLAAITGPSAVSLLNVRGNSLASVEQVFQ